MMSGKVALNEPGFFGADDQSMTNHGFNHLRPVRCAPLPRNCDVEAVAGRAFLLNKLSPGERCRRAR